MCIRPRVASDHLVEYAQVTSAPRYLESDRSKAFRFFEMFKASLSERSDLRNLPWDLQNPMPEGVAAKFSSLCKDWFGTPYPMPFPPTSSALTAEPEPPSRTFHGFVDLPNELKLQILKAATQPRIVTIRSENGSKRTLSSDSGGPAYSYTGLLGANRFTRNSVCHLNTIKHVFRTFMLNNMPVVLNIKTDILYFDTVETLMGFLNAGGPEARQEVKKQCIKRIAVGYQLSDQESWNIEKFRSIAKAVNWFGVLEKLFLVESGLSSEGASAHLPSLQKERENFKFKCTDAIEEELRKWKGLWDSLEKATGSPCKRWIVPEFEVTMKGDLESKF